LDHLKLLLYNLEPIVSIHRLDRVRESRWLGALKVSKSIPRWCWWRLVLSILHVDHHLLHSLKHLSLHQQNLLQNWWRVGSVVVLNIIVIYVGVVVPCVDHLKNFDEISKKVGGEEK
jgi:hypothetical protein